MNYISARLLCVVLLSYPLFSMAQATAESCSGSEHKQFDFWLGEWDLRWGDDGARGTNVITRILDNCIIHEHFNGGDSMPLRGMSYSAYDPETGKWRQTWVDNNGTYLDFTGGMTDGKMILERSFTRAGKILQQRMIFRDIRTDSLVWDWQLSEDNGKTWQTTWQIHYQRRQ
jgi:hypothetical protein